MQQPSNAVDEMKNVDFKQATRARHETQEEEQHKRLKSKNCVLSKTNCIVVSFWYKLP
jgi:hypothetical protein